jgi:hypothetical protein
MGSPREAAYAVRILGSSWMHISILAYRESYGALRMLLNFDHNCLDSGISRKTLRISEDNCSNRRTGELRQSGFTNRGYDGPTS